MPHRRAVVCRDVEEAAAALEKSSGRRSRSEGSTAARLVFMFPGQGSQYPAMGRELYATQPVFRRHVDAAAEILRPALGFDLRQIVSGGVSDEAHARLRDTRIAQPAIFTVSYALAQLVMSWGLQPAGDDRTQHRRVRGRLPVRRVLVRGCASARPGARPADGGRSRWLHDGGRPFG
jgi:acyl transferase domain-containing protein